MKLICFYGPESVGKTTMATELAKQYGVDFVHEVARDHITDNDFTIADILTIGKAQTRLIQNRSLSGKSFLLCDSDLITTQIYSQLYLKQFPAELLVWEKEIVFNAYFFFDIDTPWVADGMRDLQHRRREMREIFLYELNKRNIHFTWVRGDWQQRRQTIVNYLDTL